VEILKVPRRQGDGFLVQGAGEGGDFAGRLAFLRERDEKFRLARRRNFFIGQQFDGGVDLRVLQRLRGGELLNERCEHARILRRRAGGRN